jgi:hypothetical protein
MDPSATNSHSAALIDRVGTVVPSGLAPFVASPAQSAPIRQVAFRFSYRDVPCTAISEQRGSDSILRLVCNFGPLPYTAEGAQPRRRALQAIALAKNDTGLDWHLSASQVVVLTNDVALTQPYKPATMIAGVVGLLLRADQYIGLLREILGSPGDLTAPQAA